MFSVGSAAFAALFQAQKSAKLMAEKEEYHRAIILANRRGSNQVIKRKGQWFALVSGKSRIPKIRRKTCKQRTD